MSHGPKTIAVVLSSGSTAEPVIGALRACCGWQAPEIVRAIKNRAAIPVGTVFGTDHPDQLHRINRLFDHLAELGQPIEIQVGDTVVSRDEFNDKVADWHAVGEEVDDDIESGFWNMKNS